MNEQTENNNNNMNAQTEDNNSSGNLNMKKTYRIDIVDNRKGHDTQFAEGVESAVETIISAVEESSRWLYINNRKFEFNVANSLRSEQNVTKLAAALQQEEDPLILLSGELKGGLV